VLGGGVLALILGLGGLTGEARAQPVDFGSADDPREHLQRVWWRRQSSLDMRTGLSLIADHWRAGIGMNLNLVRRSVTARLNGVVRGGIYGRYDPDTDELYDLVRLVDFARYNPPRQSRFYLRGGAIDRMRLGTGHVVNFYSSRVAWDRRTIGVESMWGTPLVDLYAFAGDVRMNGLVGARVAVRPLAGVRSLRMRSLMFGATYVTDRASNHPDTLGITAYNVDISLNALPAGDIRLVPFSSFAWYPAYGKGLAIGASVESDNFIDLARFRLRLAVYYSGREFIPGYVGAFYMVSNPEARIVDSHRYLVGDRQVAYEGVSLEEALGGNDFETEMRLLVWERFEFWYYFRRHYGTQRLSEMHFRLYFHDPRRLRVDVGVDRAGLRGFFSLFNNLGDQSALAFGLHYRIAGPFWLFANARYTFEYVGTGADGIDHYLIQRRFEPFVGIRFDF